MPDDPTSDSAPEHPLDDAPTREAPIRTPSSPRAPERIGPYRILQRLGQGGMGEVWEAEQTEPVKRRVAVKLLRRGLDSERLLARFENERQALAVMDHPYVARVLDAGIAEDGRHYFVMERVPGVPITEYCDRERLDMRQRIELFLEVCEGVQHAHQKAILHRDLKPSNILVAEHEGRAHPKVIDFGIAKVLTGSLTERTLYTEIGRPIGTPEYMSPEQFGESDVDIRTDVYSLGVLLYVLLVGVLPFDSRALREAGLHEAVRLIRDTEPPRPSHRLKSLGADSTTTAAARRSDAGTLVSELRGDLDWIVLKAISADRGRRYGTVAELADDLERFLEDRPVEARPPSTGYLLHKFAQRHRAVVAGAALAMAALLVGLGLATWGWITARQAEAVALREAEKARNVSDFLIELFETSDPSRSRGNEITAREVLDRGVERIETSLTEEPETRAGLLEVMGRVYIALGLYDDARPLLDQSVELYEALPDVDPLELADALDQLATAHAWQGESERAVELARRSLSLREAELGPDDPALGPTLNALGNALEDVGDLEASEETHRRALALREAEGDPVALAQTLHNLGIAHLQQGELEIAEGHLRRAAELEREARGVNNDRYATSLHVLAITLQRLERFDEAIEVEDEALAVRERVLGPDHPHVSFSLTTLAELYREVGRIAETEPLLRRAIEIGTETWGPVYAEVRWMKRNLAETLDDLGRHREAETVLLDLLRESEEADLDGALTPTLNALGRHDLERGDLERAEEMLERSLEIEERVSGRDHPYVTEALLPLARVQAARGLTELAERTCRRAVAIVEEALDPADADRSRVVQGCAELLS